MLFGWSLVEGLGAVLVIPAIAALTAADYQGKERAFASSLWGCVQPLDAPTIAGNEITPLGFSLVPFLIVGGVFLLWFFGMWEENRRRGRGLQRRAVMRGRPDAAPSPHRATRRGLPPARA